MFVYYLCAAARPPLPSSSSEMGVRRRPLVVGNSLEDIFGSTITNGNGGMRRRERATALMNACQHELPLDVALIIHKKVRHSGSLHSSHRTSDFDLE